MKLRNNLKYTKRQFSSENTDGVVWISWYEELLVQILHFKLMYLSEFVPVRILLNV
jgi:hypothetical protein